MLDWQLCQICYPLEIKLLLLLLLLLSTEMKSLTCINSKIVVDSVFTHLD